MFPILGLDVMNGLKIALKKNDITPNFIVEGIGTAADDSLLKLAEKFLLQENVDITIAFCGNNKLKQLVSLFDNYKKPLIRLDLGGSVLKQDHSSPYVLHHTFNLWQSAYAAGKHAALQYGKKASVISSIYDGGYHMSGAFAQGFSSQGGTIASYYVSPMDYKSESFEQMVQELEEVSAEVIFAIFSFKEGRKVFDVLSKSKINGSVPILTIPLMTDATELSVNFELKEVHSIASWSFDDESEGMKTFLREYQDAYEAEPNILGLLGFEAGLSILQSISSEGTIATKIAEVLRNKTIATPRGSIHYNAMNESQTETFKVRKFQYNKTKYHNVVVADLDASYSEKLYKEFEEFPEPAWQNPYLCT